MPAGSSTNQAPSADRFPEYPASWYLFCGSADLRKGPVSKQMLGRRLVAFRTAGGKFTVMQANCAHLGADLGCGEVVGETIQCPFHGWRYATDGACTHIPGAKDIPAFARLRTYPVVERHGYVFFFNGAEPLFRLPFFFGEEPDDFVAGKPFRYVADCAWYMNAANGFDMQHFLNVHGRKLIGSPGIDFPAPFACRNRYQARVVGRSKHDWFLRTFVGRTVGVSITCWGGTYMLMTADFAQAYSCFLIATQPLDNGQTLNEGIVFAHRGGIPLLRGVAQPLNLSLRRYLTYGFVADEAVNLRGIRYNPAALIKGDAVVVDFLSWVAQLSADKPVHAGDQGSPARTIRAAAFN
jgi:nitrite reductase/ring-hydroxylating ferredoxin subunit